MKYLTPLLFMMMTIVIAPTTVQAEDIFSHTVLTLPDDPEKNEAWGLTISTEEQWAEFYGARLAAITYLEGNEPVRPNVNFDEFQILTGGLGQKPTFGHYLTVERVTERDDVIEIHIFNVSPGKNCITLPALSFPSATVVVNKVDKPFRFVETPLVRECK